jgi:hypothetical protein
MKSRATQFLFSVTFAAMRGNRGYEDGSFERAPMPASVFIDSVGGAVESAIAASWLVAPDERGAELKAAIKARELFPPTEGWGHHRIAVCAISPVHVKTFAFGVG